MLTITTTRLKQIELSAILGVLLILFSGYLLLTNLFFIYQANISKGEITAAACESANTGRFNHVICNYTITFHTYEDNKAHTIVKRFSSSHGYHLNEEVSLVYPPDEPELANIYDETLWLFPVGLLTIGLFFTLVPHLK